MAVPSMPVRSTSDLESPTGAEKSSDFGVSSTHRRGRSLPAIAHARRSTW